jgi:glycosyltransferase involved in cell wall biosynthesis
MRLLMLITSLAGGGAERCASELSLNLSPGIEREFVTLLDRQSYPVKDRVTCLGLGLEPLTILNLLTGLFLGVIRYRRAVKKYSPDVSLSFLMLDNTINILSNIGNKKVKKIVSVHIALSEKFKSPFAYVFAKLYFYLLYNRADMVIAVSSGVRDELVNEFHIDPSKVKILFNPTDVKLIEKLAGESVGDEQWCSDGTPFIMNVGRLTRQKGQSHLIRAFSKVREQRACKLVIRGDGEYKQYLEGLVHELGMAGDVKFLGWKENPYKYISRSCIFILSSLWEALPYALIESMACGCPVISTDCKYGPREILKDGACGILVPAMDGVRHKASDPLAPEEEALADAIIRLLDDEALRKNYSERSRARAMDFDKGRIIEEYESYIQKMNGMQASYDRSA